MNLILDKLIAVYVAKIVRSDELAVIYHRDMRANLIIT